MFRRIPEKCESTLSAHQGPANNVIFNTNGEYCVTCGDDRSVVLWNPYTPRKVFAFSGHSSGVNDVAVNHDNTRIGSAGSDRQVLIFDTLKGHPIRHFRGHTGTVNCVEFSRDSRVVVSGSYDRSVRLWDFASSRSSEPLQILNDATDSILSLCVRDELILTASVDGGIRTYDIRMGTLRTDKLEDAVTSVELTYDRKCILASTLDSSICLIDLLDAQVLNVFRGHVNTRFRCCSRFVRTTNGTDEHMYVMSGSENGEIVYWGMVNGNVEGRVRAHRGCAVRGVDVANDGLYVVSCSNRGELKLWKRVAQ